MKPTGIVNIGSDKKSLTLIKKEGGDFTATLVLKHSTKPQQIIENANFQILPIDALDISKWTAGWRNNKAQTATITGNQIRFDVTSADFLTEVTLASEGASISPDPNTITDWSNKVTFTVTNTGITKTKAYEVKVTVDGKDIITTTDANIQTTINNEMAKFGNITTTANFNHIDVGEVTNMKDVFKDITTFNGDISKWDVSKVTNMQFMFYKAREFNRDIGSWKVDKVINMNSMFYRAREFNRDIGSWKVDKVINMNSMFYQAIKFNQDIGSWKVDKVTNMTYMFYQAIKFNQDIGSWKVDKVTNMTYMFYTAEVFNQDIGSWNVSKVTNMERMFGLAIVFNQNISSWNVNQVTNCRNFSIRADVFQTANKPTFTSCTP